MGHGHAHDHSHHSHGHAAGHALRLALLVTLIFAGVEAVGGWWAGSLALLGDAGHMFSDATALGISALAAWISRRPPSARHSYGLMRAEIVAALLNGALMLLVVVGIVVEAIGRLQAPAPVAGGTVMLIAFVGLVVNAVTIWLLSHGESSINTRAALLHVTGDLLGSVAALLAGAVVFYTGWTPIDPILSLVICALILYSTVGLLREAVHVLMEGVPLHLDLTVVGQSMAEAPGALSIHDLHIWTLSSGSSALSAHVVVEDLSRWTELLNEMRAMLQERFHISHVTLQPEIAARVPARAYSPVIPIHPHDTEAKPRL
jgi:cobalt-zinc-cadmium efflux system protein